MAKISARGAVKLASAMREETDADGYRKRLRLALRSDGAILRAIDLLSPENVAYGSRGWNRGGYSIVGKVRKDADALRVFTAYAERRGCTVKAGT